MDTGSSPQGGARSQQRLLEAARELLAEKPAPEVTVREIAARAGVQHALIRRHFGSRDALLGLVVAETLAQFAAEVESADDLAASLQVGFEQFNTNLALTSGMAMLVVSQEVREFQRYPLADAYQAQLARAGMDPGRTRDIAVVIIALMSGWMVGERLWLGMADRRDDPRSGLDMVERAVWAVIDRAMTESNVSTESRR